MSSASFQLMRSANGTITRTATSVLRWLRKNASQTVEEIAAAGVQSAQQAARMLPVVECQRQRQGVLEEVDDRRQLTPVRQAIRMQCHQDVSRDAEESDAGPPGNIGPGAGR